MSKVSLKLVLKKNWDSPIYPPREKPPSARKSGIFLGRDFEVELLVNEINRNSSGSILVSGYRGVGKTSFVYKALHKLDDKKNIIVLLNSAQLVAETEVTGEKIHPKIILENLIRRLYSASRNIEGITSIKKRIKKLYIKAVAKEYSVDVSQGELSEKSQQDEEVNRTTILLNSANIKWLIILGSFLFAFIVHLFTQSESALNQMWRIVSLLVAIVFPNIWTFKKHKSKTQVKTKKRESSISEYYNLDNCIGNLEYDLEQIHINAKTKRKIIYIIDELDKLANNQALDLLRFFKNFFTLSNAIFIFIGDEDTYKMGREKKGYQDDGNINQEVGYYRDRAYTYFSSRYYLPRPSWKDLQHYFEEITESFSGDRKLKEKILRYACYNAKNDFFDLKSMIKSLISGFDNSGHPYINISSDEEIHMKSYLHRIITLFENIYYVNDYLKQSGNEDIMRLLFKITDEITVSPPGANFLDPEDSSLKSSIKREFYNFLYKLEIFSLSRIEKNLVINTINIPIRRYVYNQQYKNTIPSSIFDLTEKQVRYRTYVNVYANKIIALYNAYANLMGFDIDRSTIKEKFKNKRDFYRNIGYDLSLISSHIDADQELGITRKRQYFTDEEITKKIDEINTQRRNYIMRLPRLISEIIKKIHSKRNIYVSKTISISSLSPDICAEMSAHNMHLLEFGNSEDQLMLLYDDGNLSKETSNALKSLGNYMIVVIKEKKGGTKYGHKLSEIIVDEKFEQSLIDSLKEVRKYFQGQ